MDLKEYLPQIKPEEKKEKCAIDWLYSKFVEQGKINVFKKHLYEIEEAISEANYNAEFDEHYGDIAKLLYGKKVEGSFLEMILEEAGAKINKTETVILRRFEEDDDLNQFDIEEEMIEQINEFDGRGIIEIDSFESEEAYMQGLEEQGTEFLRIANGILLVKDEYESYENLIYLEGDESILSRIEEAWGYVNSSTDILFGTESTVLMIIESEGQWETWDLNDTVQSFVKYGLINIPHTLQTNNILVSAWNAIELIKKETREVIL